MDVIAIVVVVVLYVVTYPAFLWTYNDLRRYPRQLWSAADHQPYAWRQATIVAYLAFGLPVLIVAIAWRANSIRQTMRHIAHSRVG